MAMWSSSSPWPYFMPPRARTRCGALVMLSMPPATATSMLPAHSWSWASITAFRPEPHILLMVSAVTLSGSPALRLA